MRLWGWWPHMQRSIQIGNGSGEAAGRWPGSSMEIPAPQPSIASSRTGLRFSTAGTVTRPGSTPRRWNWRGSPRARQTPSMAGSSGLPDGSPQGTLHEGAMDLADAVVPETGPAEWERALLAGQEYLLALGITGWQDADVQPAQEAAYLAVAGRGDLIASVVGALWWDRHRGHEQIEESDRPADAAWLLGTGLRASS